MRWYPCWTRLTTDDWSLTTALRLLLRHAVQRPKPPDQIARIYGHDFAGREEFGQRVQRDAVIGIIEDRNQHTPIRDIVIRIARGQTPPLEHDRARHGNLHHVEPLSILIARGPQASQVVLEGRIIRILRIRLNHGENRIAGDEAG